MRLRATPAFLGGPKPGHAAPSLAQASTELCVQEMDDAGISVGVIMGRQVTGDRHPLVVPNDEIAQACREYPGRFLGFAGADVGSPDLRGALKEVQRAVGELGMAGVNLEPAMSASPRYADDPALFPIYAWCQDVGVPVSISLSILIARDLS